MIEAPEQPAELPENSAFLPEWEWDAVRYRAASRVADGSMKLKEIAAEAGISERQFRAWKKHPPFAALVRAIRGEVESAFRGEAVATKSGRLRILIDMHNKLLAVIEARAAAAIEMQELQPKGKRTARNDRRLWAAGEDTGVIVTKETWGKTNSQESAIDTGAFKTMLELQERISRELGQWTEKVEHSGGIRIEIAGMATEELP